MLRRDLINRDIVLMISKEEKAQLRDSLWEKYSALETFPAFEAKGKIWKTSTPNVKGVKTNTTCVYFHLNKGL